MVATTVPRQTRFKLLKTDVSLLVQLIREPSASVNTLNSIIKKTSVTGPKVY